jgi:hypothetical protein
VRELDLVAWKSYWTPSQQASINFIVDFPLSCLYTCSVLAMYVRPGYHGLTPWSTLCLGWTLVIGQKARNRKRSRGAPLKTHSDSSRFTARNRCVIPRASVQALMLL